MDARVADPVLSRPRASSATAAADGPMPPEAPRPMPVQDLRAAPDAHQRSWPGLRVTLARGVAGGITLGIVAYGTAEMFAIMRNEDFTVLQVALVVVFAATLGWIAQAAGSALAGLLPLPRQRLAERDLPRPRTALVMPIYNEDPRRTTAALRAMAEDLAALGEADGYEIVLLSDSTRADAWIRETLATQRLREALAGRMPVWYRRRWRNTCRKAGNIQDFVERWGARYEYMVVLDADSLVEADTLLWLVRAMQADAQLGLLQTVPRLVGRLSLFARLQQFAGRVYGPTLARGASAWAGDDGNYWGHNAIIRLQAFADSCGLPELRGRKPFGGHILSHDFVEAALMRRAGWKVRMATEVDGSYEESPPTLLDTAIRDRRWAQGNLQHAKVLGARGLRWHSRLHFAFGIMSYLSSPLWLLLLLLGIALSIQAGLHDWNYFANDFQLFPDWPVFDAERMLRLFLFSVAVLFLPKALGYLRSLASRRIRRSVGSLALTVSVLLEVLLTALYAPVMMLMQARHVLEILTGRDAGWGSQQRDERGGSWREAWRFHWAHTFAGLALVGVFAVLEPSLLWWLTPVIAGLLLSVPLSHFSGSQGLGRALARVGLLRTPEEVEVPGLVRRRDELVAAAAALPDDGLRTLAGDEAARRAHLAMTVGPPPARRGHPDPARLTAEQRLREARTLDELLDWLTPPERLHVAADPRLLQRLAALPRGAPPA
jgi:membrane glycosyltransferase